jgi:phospholipase C
MSQSNYQYFISQDPKTDQVLFWYFDPGSSSLLKRIPGKSSKIAKGDSVIQVGNYILQWSALTKDNHYAYRLLEVNMDEADPLGSFDKNGKWTQMALQSGVWTKAKFFNSRPDFANPGGADKGYEKGSNLLLVSAHNFVLNWIPTAGRGTYQLFNFDAGSPDPLPGSWGAQGSWLTIQQGHELAYVSGYILDRDVATSNFSIWQFDAQCETALSYPSIRKGNWKKLGITSKHRLTVLGNYVLDQDTTKGTYRLWEFDKDSETGLKGPVTQGAMPSMIAGKLNLTGIETLIPVDAKLASKPGTMDFMRDKIKHVVYYMIENRSFDHLVGWLYDKKAPIKVIGPEGPYRGVDPKFTNEYNGKKYPITQYNNGKLSSKIVLDLDHQDPYHDCSDVLRQMFHNNVNDYFEKKNPDMGGFAFNNGTEEVMIGYSPDQLPVINGLAGKFAISDDWFCSVPSGTTVNRAFAFTGSTLGRLNNFQNGVDYTAWSQYPRRPSIWKVLWDNGIKSFKLYNSMEWLQCAYTYNLFLKGQIPSIDGPFTVGNYAAQLNQFFDDVKYGTLPSFSFLEPKWVTFNASTSYHPGNDLIPGERELNDIITALQESPAWENTLLVINFDEHGGLPDHVRPPYAVKPYANDSFQGFEFDLMGPRIPAILVSPWITENTVFRSETGTPYCNTSILSTVLQWLGVPKSRWALGERTNHAPSFEAVIREKKPRTDKVKLSLPYDKNFPSDLCESNVKADGKHFPPHDLHRLMLPALIADIAPGLTNAERAEIEDEINSKAVSLHDLHKALDMLHKKHN